MIYQLALAAIHLAYVNSRILLCGLRTLNVLSGGAVNFTDYDINADSDVCSIMLATSSYQDQSTEDRIAALQRDVAATSVGVVGVKDARGGDMLRTGPEFGVDVMQTVLAAPVAAIGSKKAAAKLPARIQGRVDYRVALFYITAGVDWLAGVLASFALFVKLWQPECRATPDDLGLAVKCVCGDEQKSIRFLAKARALARGDPAQEVADDGILRAMQELAVDFPEAGEVARDLTAQAEKVRKANDDVQNFRAKLQSETPGEVALIHSADRAVQDFGNLLQAFGSVMQGEYSALEQDSGSDDASVFSDADRMVLDDKVKKMEQEIETLREVIAAGREVLRNIESDPDPAFWCTGILQLVDGEGVVRFVLQEESYQALRARWIRHGEQQVFLGFLHFCVCVTVIVACANISPLS